MERTQKRKQEGTDQGRGTQEGRSQEGKAQGRTQGERTPLDRA